MDFTIYVMQNIFEWLEFICHKSDFIAFKMKWNENAVYIDCLLVCNNYWSKLIWIAFSTNTLNWSVRWNSNGYFMPINKLLLVYKNQIRFCLWFWNRIVFEGVVIFAVGTTEMHVTLFADWPYQQMICVRYRRCIDSTLQRLAATDCCWK